MKKYYITMLCLSLCTLFSCHPEEMAPKALIKYVQQSKSGMQKQFEDTNFLYTLKYLPNDFQLAKRCASKDSDKQLEKYKNQIEGHHYFSLNIKCKNGQNLSEELMQKYGNREGEEMMNNLRFHVVKQFSIHSHGNTMPCSLYHFDDFNMPQQGVTFSLVFRDDQLINKQDEYPDDIQFSFQNTDLGNVPVNLVIQKEQINNIPSLKI